MIRLNWCLRSVCGLLAHKERHRELLGQSHNVSQTVCQLYLLAAEVSRRGLQLRTTDDTNIRGHEFGAGREKPHRALPLCGILTSEAGFTRCLAVHRKQLSPFTGYFRNNVQCWFGIWLHSKFTQVWAMYSMLASRRTVFSRLGDIEQSFFLVS